MIRNILALLVIFICGSLNAAEIKLAAGVSLKATATGTVTPDANGNPVFTLDADSVITIVGNSPTPPQPPVPGPVLTARAIAVRDSSAKATTDPKRDATAGELGALYGEIAKKVRAKEIVGQSTIAAVVKGTTDMLLTPKGAAVEAAWKPTRDVIAAQWTKLAQEGGKDEDFVKLLEEAADGFNASVKLVQAIDIQVILKIIQMIMELLKLFPAAR